MPNKNLFKAFSSQEQEVDLEHLTVSGEIPQWLSGSFISNGPAKFEVGSLALNHWFDGLAMLKNFSIRSGKISFKNRFLRSQQYLASQDTGRLNVNEFATYKDNSLWGRISESIKGLIKNTPYDNCNVNICSIAEHFVAMTEGADLIEFTLKDLHTVGHFQFLDKVPGQMMPPHPQFDVSTKEIINVRLEIGKSCRYHIYSMEPGSLSRKIIHTYSSNELFYMHSFSITPHYVILFQSPLEIKKLNLMFGMLVGESFFWKENKPSFFIIIDRRNGHVHKIEADPFICLHSINAYENNAELILDLICYDQRNPYNPLYLSNLRSETPEFPFSSIRRYVIDLTSKHCRYDNLSSMSSEFPRIHYSMRNGKAYQFAYTLTTYPDKKFFNAIQKLDVQTGKTLFWEKENYYPGEAVFVAKPDAQAEDDGVLLSIVFDFSSQSSTLIILDAQSMQQMAEAYLPFHLPAGFHGNFYKD